MAIMYPKRISPSTKSKAEKILFDKFQSNLSDEYCVLHSREWILPGKNNKGGIEGECDFIVLHPKNGILFIEAKSGFTFTCHSDGNNWYCKEFGELKNPFWQANKSKWRLINFLKEKNIEIKLPYSHAAAFPQASRFRSELPPDILPEMIFFEPDLYALDKKIPKAMAVVRKPSSDALPDEDFQRIIHALIPVFGITTTASSGLTTFEREFFELEKEQLNALDIFETNKKVLVKGCAGSGKTIIAIEKARRLATDNKSILFLTYNIAIADHVRQRIFELDIAVDVYHFHGLCQKVIEDTGEKFEIDNRDIDKFWDLTCPQTLSEKLEFYRNRYDALIIDEFQDFNGEWVDVATKLLKDKENGTFYAFTDEDQNIFIRNTSGYKFGAEISLGCNMRNNPSIVNWINKFCKTKMVPFKELSLGPEPQIITTESDKDEIQKISKVIKQLTEKTSLKSKHIIILGKYSFKNSIFSKVKRIGNFTMSENPIWSGNENEIRYSSIYRFKGLETECAILSGFNLEPRHDIKEDILKVLYSATSRAKVYLLVFLRSRSA